MDSQVVARERARVRNDTQELAVSLGKKLGVDVPQNFGSGKTSHDPRVRALRQEEAIRDFLAELDDAVKAAPKSRNKQTKSSDGKPEA